METLRRLVEFCDNIPYCKEKVEDLKWRSASENYHVLGYIYLLIY